MSKETFNYEQSRKALCSKIAYAVRNPELSVEQKKVLLDSLASHLVTTLEELSKR